MRNYITAFLRLPAILDRINRELEGKASSSALAVVCAHQNAVESRLAKRVTKTDLTTVESDLGSRLEALESRVTAIAYIVERTGSLGLHEALDAIQKASLEPDAQAVVDRVKKRTTKAPTTPKDGGAK